MKKARPRGIIIIVILEVLTGLLSVAGGIGASALHNHSQPQGLGFLQALAPEFPAVLITLGVFFFILSMGLWRGYRWAWILTFVFSIVHIIADVGFITARSFTVDKIIGLIVILGIMCYLALPKVREYFRKAGSLS